MPDKPDDRELAALAQSKQLQGISEAQGKLEAAARKLAEDDASIGAELSEVSAQADKLLAELGLDEVDLVGIDPSAQLDLPDEERRRAEQGVPDFKVPVVLTADFDSWTDYASATRDYLRSIGVDLAVDPLAALPSGRLRSEVRQRLEDDYTFHSVDCDRWDYAIAASVGAAGGLIDAFFVGMPGTGALGKLTDEGAGSAVQGLARRCGWKGPREGSEPLRSAIGFLERNFPVPYDHRYASEVFTHIPKTPENFELLNTFKMSASNHHLKSLAHSPSPVGLFFSILNQFANTASFVDRGRVITIDASDRGFYLQGNSFPARLYCGFVNWFFHVVSDMAGSSSSMGRGAGVGIPFFELFLLADVGSFGEDGATIAQLAVKVYEKGYDLRHGGAMAIPVVLVELFTRLLWLLKRRFHHGRPWRECLPSTKHPALRRMLVVGHGTLCLVDATDAGVRSGFEPVGMLTRMNLFGWVRFGGLALRDARASLTVGKLDLDRLDNDIDADLARMLA